MFESKAVSLNLPSLPPEVLRQVAFYLPLPDIRSLLLSNPCCFHQLHGHTTNSVSFAPWRRRFFVFQRIYQRTVREAQDRAVNARIQGQSNIVASGQTRTKTRSEQELEEISRAIARDIGLLPALFGGRVDTIIGPILEEMQQGERPNFPQVLLPTISLKMIFYALEQLSEAGIGHLSLPPLLCPLSAIIKTLAQTYPSLELVQKFIPVRLLPQSSSQQGIVAETAAAYKILTAYLLCTSLTPNDILGVLSDASSVHLNDKYAVEAARGDQEMALVEYFHFLQLFLTMYECDQTLRLGVRQAPSGVASDDIMTRQGRRVLGGRLDTWVRGYFRPERPLTPQPVPLIQEQEITREPYSNLTPERRQFRRTPSMGSGTPLGLSQGTTTNGTLCWHASPSNHSVSSPMDFSPRASPQSRPAIALTREQQRIVDTNVGPGDLMKVRAYAGTGKTMSLTEYAKARPQLKILYVAFNKSAQMDAEKKFTRNVDCKTMHSIALRALHITGPGIKDSLPDYNKTTKDRKRDGRMPTMEIPQYSFSAKHVSEMLCLENNTNRIISALANPSLHLSPGAKKRQVGWLLFPAANAVATCVKKALEKYWSSKDLELDRKHLPFAMIEKLGLKSDVLLKWAEGLWKGMVAAKMKYIPHDGYLKLLQLDGAQKNEEGAGEFPVRGDGDKATFGQYDVIMFDEAQDSNPSMADVILRQRPWAGLIVVGDPYQKIYGFRGATNECFDDAVQVPTHSLYLTHSFRFGDGIAGVANVLLRALREKVGVNGVRKKDSVKRSFCQQFEMSGPSELGLQVLKPGNVEDGGSGKYTVIFRKNISLVEYAIEYCVSHSHLHHRIALNTARNFNKTTLFTLLKTAFKLFHKEIPARTGILAGYKTWQELKDHVEAENSEDGSGGTDSPGLGLVVGLEEYISKPGFMDTIMTCEDMVTEKSDEADVILITTHQAKGLEWDRVVVADDFNPPYDRRESLGTTKFWREEMFMTYVAVTRAKKELIVSEGIVAWLAGEMGAYRFYISPGQGKEKCPICCDHRQDVVENAEEVQPRREALLIGYESLLPTGSFGLKINEPAARARRPHGGKKDMLVCDLCVQKWSRVDRTGTYTELMETSLPFTRMLDAYGAASPSTQSGISIGALTERNPLSAVYQPTLIAESNRVRKWATDWLSLSDTALRAEENLVHIVIEISDMEE